MLAGRADQAGSGWPGSWPASFRQTVRPERLHDLVILFVNMVTYSCHALREARKGRQSLARGEKPWVKAEPVERSPVGGGITPRDSLCRP
jgi:hypothetical protein